VTSQTWNAKSELIDLIDGAGHTSIRGYDGSGNQIILTNRLGNVWQFQFDGANRLTNTISPLHHSTTVTFNHQGFPVLVTDPLSQITTNGYDAKSRLTNRADSFGTTLYGYDADDNLTSVSENGLTNTWTHDAYDRVSSYEDVYGNLIQYRYDANGNVTNLIYPGGRNVYYGYDSENHMTSVTDWSGRVTTMTYDLNGRLTSVTRPNGTSRTINYDNAGEVTNVLEQMANGLPIALMRYNWDQAARMSLDFIAPLPHTNAPPLRNMTYDADNELATFQGPTMGSAESVTVDADGNLLSGPLTNDTFSTYTYDARNRLQNVGGVTNIYDAMNNRVGQIYGTNSIEYVINPNTKLPQVLERIKNGVTTYYIYGSGLLYQITEAPTGTNTVSYHYDCRGSTIALTGDNGLVTDRMEYSIYATMTYHVGTNDTPFLFNGRYGVMSDPNGLLYMRARYYNPYLCRFLNPDPKGFAAGMNFYVYANGNPASLIDPFGTSAIGDYFEGVGQVFEGYGLAARDTAVGLYNVVDHPVNTVEGLANIAENPVQAYEAISTSVENTWNSGLEGQGEIVGNLLIAAATVGGGSTMGAARLAEINEGVIATADTDASYATSLLYYEIGQKTMSDAAYAEDAVDATDAGYADYLNPVDRGAAIVADQGWINALLPQSSGWYLGLGSTFTTDPTPLGWLGIAGFGATDVTGQLGTYGSQMSFGSSTGK
jgi:RHS repeat-associated protein